MEHSFPLREYVQRFQDVLVEKYHSDYSAGFAAIEAKEDRDARVIDRGEPSKALCEETRHERESDLALRFIELTPAAPTQQRAVSRVHAPGRQPRRFPPW